MSHHKAIREAFLDEATKYRQEADVASTTTLRTVSLLIADVMELAAKEWRQLEIEAEAKETGRIDVAIPVLGQLLMNEEEITDELPTGAHRSAEKSEDLNIS